MNLLAQDTEENKTSPRPLKECLQMISELQEYWLTVGELREFINNIPTEHDNYFVRSNLQELPGKLVVISPPDENNQSKATHCVNLDAVGHWVVSVRLKED